MPQTILSSAVLGPRYTANIKYRLYDITGNSLSDFTNPTHLSNGIWQALVQLPDAGGQVHWYKSTSQLLAVEVVNASTAINFPDNIGQEVWTYAQRTLTQAPGLTTQQAQTLQSILDQLQADYFKGDDRFIRYLKNTNTVILDKDVSFDPDQGYTVTEHT